MSDNRLQIKGFFVWGICALFFLYEFFLRTVIGTYQDPLMKDLNLTSFQLSLLSTTVFLLVYGIMQIPASLIVNNIGLKKSLFIGTICCTISSLGLSYANSYLVAIFYRVIMGFGASFGFICLLVSVYEWMPHKYRAIFIGLSQFIGTLGPMVAAGPLNSVSEAAGVSWRFVFLCLSGIGIFLAILVLFLVENKKQKASKYIILNKPEKVSVSLLRLFFRVQPWYLAVLSASLYFTVEYLSENEGRAFLMLKGISINSASYMITISWIGYAIGCPLLGFLSDIFERRKIMMQFCAIASLISTIMILYTSDKLTLQIAFLLLGFGASGQTIGFAAIAEQFKKQFVTIGFGLNNAMITTSLAVCAPLIGILFDHYTQFGRSITLNEYLLVFNILIVIAAISLVISFFFIKETYCKSFSNFTIVAPQKSKGDLIGRKRLRVATS